MNQELLNKFIEILKQYGRTQSAYVLYCISTEITSRVEAFNLGRDLQRIFDMHVEQSNVANATEEEFIEVMRFIEAALANG